VRPCPGDCPREALDDAEAAPLERALADHPASELGEVIDAGPADVTAARALAGIEMANFAGRVPPGSAGKALDPDLLFHLVKVGTRVSAVATRTRDASQSVEYFGWIFSPRI
jgi:hypothetical protein